MSLFGYLKSGKVEELPATKGGGPRKQRNPDPALVAIRVFADGSVFPSQAAVDKFSLEYRNTTVKKEVVPLKEGEVLPEGVTVKTKNVYEYPNGYGNGLDVIDSDAWGQAQLAKRTLFVAVVPKSESKLDLFGTTNYDDNGIPKSTVMDQGASTFGKKTLLSLLTEVHGIVLNTDEAEGPIKPFVDLLIIEEVDLGEEGKLNIPATFSPKILFAPKVVARGENVGKADFERRENVKVYLLVPKEEEKVVAEADNVNTAEAVNQQAGDADAISEKKSTKKDKAPVTA